MQPPELTATSLTSEAVEPLSENLLVLEWLAVNDPQAFAMAVTLREQGHFTWSEWCAAMNRQILSAQGDGDPDLGDTYYHHWLAALESLAVAKGLASRDELGARRDAWDRAHRATPHGEPVRLEAAARGGKA